jgi:hypothetical protein
MKMLENKFFEPVVSVVPARGADGRLEMRREPLERASHVLLKNKAALPRAVLYHAWEGLSEEAALARLTDASWNPGSSVLVSSPTRLQPTGGPAEVPRFEDYTWERIRLVTSSRGDGVLLLNDHHEEGWKVFVDGEPQPLLRCNYLMRGVEVPAGSHEVVFEYASPYAPYVALRILTLCVALAWWTGRAAAGRRRVRAAVSAG